MLKEIISNKSVAIVGPSPHLEGQGLGNKIDNFDLVIRVNQLTCENKKDYGERTDIAFLTLTEEACEIYLKEIKRNLEEVKEIKLIVHPRHSRNKDIFSKEINSSNEDIFNLYSSLKLNNKFIHLGDEGFEKKCNEIKSFPTTGTLAILNTLESGCSELFISGFSFFFTKYRYSKDRVQLLKDINRPRVSYIGMAGHDIINEINYLRNLLQGNKSVSGDNFFNKVIKKNRMFLFRFSYYYKYYFSLNKVINYIKKQIQH